MITPVLSHAKTKSRILEAAGQEFAALGYESARVREICRRAGVNLAAINYHFGDKAQLYHEAVFEAHRGGVDDLPDADWLEGTPAERLRRFVSHFLKRVLAIDHARSWHHELMIREMMQPTQACAALVDAAIRPRFQRLREIMRALAPDVDERRLDALCFNVIGQCLFYKTARAVTTRLIGEERLAQLSREYLTEHITQSALTVATRDWDTSAPPSHGGAP